jgi:opacity protein-like surface antigen
MKKFALCALLLCGLGTCVMAAQQQATVDRPAEPNFVFDDDGGKVQIVPADFSTAGPKTFHGGPVLASAQQVSIFLGAGWGDQHVRARESSLLDVTAAVGNAHVAELQKHNIRTLRAAPRLEDFSDLSKARVNDLTIQQKLSDLLQSKAIPAPVAGTVYVIFLAPGIQSTLGAHQAGVDYVAYHNFVNLEAGEIHYVVVPFHESADHHSAAATRAFAEAALNPNGRGWF